MGILTYMTTSMIISYDGTDNDRDALALGGLFVGVGATAALAYVRHAPEPEHDRELLARRAADALLRRGGHALGTPDAERHVILHGSTGAGLRQLAERQEADLVVFGSDYRTPAGSVRAGTSAQRMLSGGPAAIALAPADMRSQDAPGFRRIGVLSEGPDLAAAETAGSIAAESGAEIVDARAGSLDLLILGSRPEAELGRVMLSALMEYAIDLSRCPVLVVPRGTALRFTPSLVTV
jgi:nucleotide-binding universal stress UspA family protein